MHFSTFVLLFYTKPDPDNSVAKPKMGVGTVCHAVFHSAVLFSCAAGWCVQANLLDL